MINEQDWRDLIRKVDETHDKVTTLTTMFNGGPGHWPSCVGHSEKLADHGDKIEHHQKMMYACFGAIGLISLVGTLLAIARALHS